MTTNAWYTLKFIPDLIVNEPYNVGVIAIAGRQVEAQFLGEDDGGIINGRKLPRGLPTQTFRDWVAFTRRTAEDGDVDERISRLAARGGDQFIIEKRGPIFGGQDLRKVVQELYTRVVTVDHSLARQTNNVAAAAESIVRSLDATLERDVTIRVTDRKQVAHELPFAYRHTGQHTTLLDRVTLRDQTSESAFIDSLMFRIGLAETQTDVNNFVVFYRAAEETRHVEEGIRRLQHYANTVDVESHDAVETVATILDVGVLGHDDVAAVVSH